MFPRVGTSELIDVDLPQSDRTINTVEDTLFPAGIIPTARRRMR